MNSENRAFRVLSFRYHAGLNIYCKQREKGHEIITGDYRTHFYNML